MRRTLCGAARSYTHGRLRAADGIAFGKPFIGNPDLPERLRTGTAGAKDEMATWYSQGAEGYVDYPTLEEERKAA